jgi:hypothetical protein
LEQQHRGAAPHGTRPTAPCLPARRSWGWCAG